MVTLLVTAGPTREHWDDVRFVSNASSGRMGYAIAAAGRAAGCRTVLVSGPTHLEPPPGVELERVVSAREMLEVVERRFDGCDVMFAVAAVADHRPAARAAGKPAKTAGAWQLELVPNPDVVATVAARKGGRTVVGFALEAEPTVAAALAKLRAKRLDLIVLNATSALGAARSAATLVFEDGRSVTLPEQPKEALAATLVATALDLHRKKHA
jgi:phosphopantothenoylcysteine decarboxylase/phosphopantothenate--cysteine ligase